MNTIEIELRYEVIDCSQLLKFLAPLQQLHTKHDIDIYYDTADARLYQQGIFIRNRNGKKLDIKFNRACIDNPDLPRQDYCQEYSYTLPLQDKDLPSINDVLVSLNVQPSPCAYLETLMLLNNWTEFYRIDKMRTSYAYNSFTIGVDVVAQLGTFLEIELMAQDVQNLEAVKQEMVLALAGLTLRQLSAGYGELLLRKQDFKRYLVGRFILEEDLPHRQNI